MRESMRPDSVISTNNFLHVSFDKIIKGIQVLLHQSSNLKNYNSVTIRQWKRVIGVIISPHLRNCHVIHITHWVTLRNSGRSWNLSTADFTGAVRNCLSMPQSPKAFPLLNLKLTKKTLAPEKQRETQNKRTLQTI